MDCELCYRSYNEAEEIVLPKVLRACPHSFCQECLLRVKEQTGKYQCLLCNATQSSDSEGQLPTNETLLKAIDHKKEEERAREVIQKYEIIEPAFNRELGKVNELLQRDTVPKELELCEVTPEGELVYIEEVSPALHKKSPFAYASPNVIIDKRCLQRNQFTYRKYVFNKDSLFMNWLSLGQHTRMIFLFRRLNTCRHKFSCAESILKRFYKWITGYLVLRVPV